MQLSNYSILLPHGETDAFERRTAKAQFIYFVDRSEAWRGINFYQSVLVSGSLRCPSI